MTKGYGSGRRQALSIWLEATEHATSSFLFRCETYGDGPFHRELAGSLAWGEPCMGVGED